MEERPNTNIIMGSIEKFFQEIADRNPVPKETEEEILEREKSEREAAEKHRIEQEQAREKEFENRKALGEKLGLGVACHVGHIIKLAGLTEHSEGNGCNRATVYHLVIDEPLKKGRLSREAGDLLCRKKKFFWTPAILWSLRGRNLGSWPLVLSILR